MIDPQVEAVLIRQGKRIANLEEEIGRLRTKISHQTIALESVTNILEGILEAESVNPNKIAAVLPKIRDRNTSRSNPNLSNPASKWPSES